LEYLDGYIFEKKLLKGGQFNKTEGRYCLINQNRKPKFKKKKKRKKEKRGKYVPNK
jgi:hypothetical protein